MASAVLTNLLTQLAGVFAIEVAASFIPGAGVVVCGVGNFAVVYIAGIIFLQTLTKMFRVMRNDVENAGDEEWIASIKESIRKMDKKALFREAKNVFMDMRKSGDLEQTGKAVDISPEDDL